jgi:hypothetical protein
VPILGYSQHVGSERWFLRIPQGLFHQTNDAELLFEAENLEKLGFDRIEGANYSDGTSLYLRMYEGRMIGLYDHRAASVEITAQNQFRSGVSVEVTEGERQNPSFLSKPRYWVKNDEVYTRLPAEYNYTWILAFKDVTSATNERTMIATIIPRTAVVYSIRLAFVFGQTAAKIACLLANWNSFVFDYLCKQATSGNHITDYIIRQLPTLTPSYYDRACTWSSSQMIHQWMLPRVLELTFTAYDLNGFAEACGYDGGPFQWDTERRFLLRSELDAAFFHLYDIAYNNVDHIMETFPIVNRRDKAQFGEYRTKQIILDVYDSMRRAIVDGTPYRTVLDPPPANIAIAHKAEEQ